MNLLDDIQAISTLGKVLVHVVDDDNAKADPRVPKSVLEKLGPEDVMIGKLARVMYIRQAHWDRIKHHFKDIDQIH